MMRYYTIQNGSILTAVKKEALEAFYKEVNLLPFDYEEGKYIVENNELILNPDFEEEQKRKKRQKLDMLSLTKREVFLALYRAKGLTPDVLKAQITNPEALIEFEYANEYFRGNPLINQIGAMLGYGADDLDYLFENKELPPSFTLTINSVPEDATVTLSSDGAKQEINSITVIQNRTVTYTVTAEGYINSVGEKVITKDETLTVELEKEPDPEEEADGEQSAQGGADEASTEGTFNASRQEADGEQSAQGAE